MASSDDITPSQDGRSPFLNLPAEIHFLIGGLLEEESLAKLARTSQEVRSFYEQQLYQGKNSTNIVKALMWGAEHDSLPAMRNAHERGANLDTQASIEPRRDNASLALATAFQVAMRDSNREATQWLWDHGVLVDIPGQPARNMCRCYHRFDINSSSLHIALCNGNLWAARLILRLPHTALEAFNFSQQFDARTIVSMAVTAAFRYRRPSALNMVLANPTIRATINVVKPEGTFTPLYLVLRVSHRYHPHSLAKRVLRILVRAGASLGPYPPNSFEWIAGLSPIMAELETGSLGTTVRMLLDVGCDPNGGLRPDDPVPVPPGWRSPLHFFIHPEHETRYDRPFWHMNPGPWPLLTLRRFQVIHMRESIGYLVRKGASLDITDFRGCSPLDNALSYMEPFLAPRRRLAGYRLVKLLLKNVTPEGISMESRHRYIREVPLFWNPSNHGTGPDDDNDNDNSNDITPSPAAPRRIDTVLPSLRSSTDYKDDENNKVSKDNEHGDT
ncbi:hypothetical protein B0T20DRAFT_397890 [Sordaria brevicollis]|uniref:Uncharacterized protein n=1 Tax=Sordaria brevicollis TaxID=83679 RepID=A0AAE0NVB9_SORBR|nr:hypothetical protein B0T20DRAFT_397890 [Sordaria brevicollis]